MPQPIRLAPGLWACDDGTYLVEPAELLPACGQHYDAGTAADLDVVLVQLMTDLGMRGVHRIWVIDRKKN